MKNFLSRLDAALSSLSYDPEKVDLLNQVKVYVQTGECLQYKNKMRYLPLWGMGSSEMAEALGVSDGTVRSAIHRMSCELDAQFGLDFFYVVETDFLVAIGRFEVIKQFRGIDSLVLPGFKQFLPVLTDDDFDPAIDIDDCKAEAMFLKRYTKRGIELDLAKLSKPRLCHLLSLIDDSGAVGDRFKLLKKLLK